MSKGRAGKKVKLGLSSFAFNWAIGVVGQAPATPMTPFNLLTRAASLGVHVVQFGDNLPLHRLAPWELQALAEQAAELNLEIETGTRGIGDEQLSRYIELARSLHSQILRVVVDTAQHWPGEDEIVSKCQHLVYELEQARVCLAIENHDRFKARTLERILERIASRCVGICLDTTNSIGAAEGPEEVFEVLGPWTVNVHLKDFRVRRMNHMMGFIVEGCPAGQGQLDIPWLLAGLRSQGRDPNVIVELWTPPEETLGASVAKEAAWAESSVQYLRTLIPE